MGLLMEKKMLLITLPVDLGNVTLEKSLIKLFKDSLDLKVYHFVPNQNQQHSNSKLDYAVKIWNRFLGSYELWQEVRKAQKEGRKILFSGVSPALFAFPAINRNSSYIVTDWTRKLYEPILGNSQSTYWHTFLHKNVLNSQKYIIGLTSAVIEEIAKDYNVPRNKLKKAKLPVDLNLFIPSFHREDNEIRLLFVGGDIHRKGGDVLIRWFKEQDNPNLKMTIVTKSPVENSPAITVEKNIQYGQPNHIEIFNKHDIFVLPTKCDAYPCVIGEAACAGLAILTTKNALGAPEIIQNGVNGYICDSQEELLNQLNTLVKNKPLIESMKRKSREFMEKEFAPELVLNQYLNYIFE